MTTFPADELDELYEVVRRVVAARVGNASDREDLVQETMARLVTRAPSDSREHRLAYAIVVARNMVADHDRHRMVAARKLPRMFSRGGGDDPLDEVVATEEHASLRTALDALPAAERASLVAHEVHGASTIDLSDARGSTPGAVAVALAATRARLRVRFLLDHHRVVLPTAQCRDVLDALSANDRRRQGRLHVDEHLERCPTCAALAQPLRHRRRTIVPAVLGIGSAAAALRWLRRSASQHPVASAGLAAAVVAGGVVVAASMGSDPPPVAAPPAAPATAPPAAPTSTTAPAPTPTAPPAPAPAPVRLADGTDLLAATGTGVLGARAGAPVVVEGAVVADVATDEGLWLSGGDPTRRFWVQLVGEGESPTEVVAGMAVHGQGVLVLHGPGYGAGAGLTGADADALDAAGAHIESSYDQLRFG